MTEQTLVQDGECIATLDTLAHYQQQSTCFWATGRIEGVWVADCVFFDALGRLCAEGADFDAAHREGAFPIRVCKRRPK